MSRLVLAALTLLAACARGPEPDRVAPLEPPQLVVLVVFDALYAGRVTHLGYERETTPNLDALAADGASFRSAFSPAPYTLAGIPSILTGRLPDHHGVTNNLARLHDEEHTLAELLAAKGYTTVAAVTNLNGSSVYGVDQGFERFVELFEPQGDEEVDHVARSGEAYRIPAADELVAFAADALARRAEGERLFLYLHVLEPHSPYKAPESFRSRWLDPAYEGRFASGETKPFVDTVHDRWRPDQHDVQAAIALYDGNLAWADHNLGHLVDLLRLEELYDDALIVVTSDHGEAMFEHGRWGHNLHLYDEMLRVPLVVKLPASRARPGLVSDTLVSTMDIVPSVCEWLDAPLPALPLDGLSIAALVEGASAPEHERELLLRSHHRIAHVGLRTPTHKTIVRRHERDARRTAVEHYWLEPDPAERVNLWPGRSKSAGPVVNRLEDWAVDVVKERLDREGGLTLREQQMLEALGYTADSQ